MEIKNDTVQSTMS